MTNTVLDTMMQQGYGQLKDGFFDEAVETFSACHALDANDDRALRGRGIAYSQLAKPILAETDFLAAKTLNNKEPENWMGLGLSLVLQNKIYEAIAVYEGLLALSPTHVGGHMQLGQLYLKIGIIAKARDYFNKILTLRPTLEQRRAVEAILKEQTKLDAGRFYRPDFDRLRKQQAGGFSISTFIMGLFGRNKKKGETESIGEISKI